MALAAGFLRARILSPFEPGLAAMAYREGGAPSAVLDNYRLGAPSLLVAALPYGNQVDEGGDGGAPAGTGYIAPFARRNYYREAVKRLKGLAAELRGGDGKKRDFRVLCNSPAPEKPPAVQSGLGVFGRNGLVITAEAGSLFVIAALTLPMPLESDGPDLRFNPCGGCDPENPPCKRACPTGALRGDGTIDLKRCIQWYASGKEAGVPEAVARQWGRRLYGCTACQDVCPHNRSPIPGVETAEGPLPAWLDCGELIAQSDGELRARFKGTALGLSWLGPAAIRRNAELVLRTNRRRVTFSGCLS
jgi:epoxyqueuosine reductase